MTSPSQRPLRVDAARNAEAIVRAAWQAFNELGIDVPLDEVARRAGVGVATLYRRFPSKDDLLMAILQWRYAEQVEPVIAAALVDEDPWHAVVIAIRASLEVAAAEHTLVKGLRDHMQLKAGLIRGYFVALARIFRRAQEAGVLRADVRETDVPMIFYMAIGAIRVADLRDDWERCLVVLLDGLRASSATPMPVGDHPAS